MVVSRGGRQNKHLADPALGLPSRRVTGRVSVLVIKVNGRVTKLTAFTEESLTRTTQLASRRPNGLAVRHEQTKLVHFKRKHDTAGAHSRFHRQAEKTGLLLPPNISRIPSISLIIPCSPHPPPPQPTQVAALLSHCQKKQFDNYYLLRRNMLQKITK